LNADEQTIELLEKLLHIEHDSIGAMRGLSNFKEWTRRSEEIGKMIGGFINASKEAEGNSEAEYTAYQSQKPMRSGGSRYSRK
ncbi:MAG: hypothetical protein Q4B26_16245, partial [Eubacteriales bacterium]|nr:hypothetical protein [Eubacteriales bacterium]